MKTHKNKQFKKIVGFVLILAMILPVFRVFKFDVSAVKFISQEEVCRRSKECQEAKEKQKAAEDAAAAASRSANAYQAKVATLTAEIATKEYEIAETEAKIQDLTKEIKAAELKLESQQDALAELLVNMHFSSDAEPIKILAGASSISDLAEKAAREATAKEQISIAAEEVKAAKEALEFDKAEVERLLAEQQKAREDMIATKSEQEELIKKYENDADAYNKVAEQARNERNAAIRAWQQENPDYFTGSAYAGDNSYPWQGDCPHKQDWYTTYQNGQPIGGYVCECVSYAGWKAYEAYGLILSWGNAYSWDDVARGAGYVVNNTPAAGTIGQNDGGAWGHVFWVESVNSDGSINVTEYNNSYATCLYQTGGNVSHCNVSGWSYPSGEFGARTISAGAARGYNYIHF